MPGRPARMMRSELCRPAVLRSTESSPVVLPDRPPPEFNRRFGHLDRGHRGGLEAGRLRAAGRAFSHFEQTRLGPRNLVQRFDLFGGVERAFDKIAAHAHQFAQQREVVNLLGQFARGKQALPIGSELREIGSAAQLGERFIALEQRLQRHRRDHHLAIELVLDAVHDLAVDRDEEVLGPNRHGHFFEQPVVDQQRAEEGCLGLGVGWQRASGGHLGCGGGLAGGADEKVFVGHGPLMRPHGRCGKGAARVPPCG